MAASPRVASGGVERLVARWTTVIRSGASSGPLASNGAMRRTTPSASNRTWTRPTAARAVGDRRQRHDQGRRGAVLGRGLQELRQVDLARAGDGGGQGLVGGRVLGRLAEQHVVDDRLGAGLAGAGRSSRRAGRATRARRPVRAGCARRRRRSGSRDRRGVPKRAPAGRRGCCPTAWSARWRSGRPGPCPSGRRPAASGPAAGVATCGGPGRSRRKRGRRETAKA